MKWTQSVLSALSTVSPLQFSSHPRGVVGRSLIVKACSLHLYPLVFASDRNCAAVMPMGQTSLQGGSRLTRL